VPGPERRLAAVLAADMVGYSRLMEVDEAGTLARLKTHRLELIDPAIAKNEGRIFKTTGDGVLVEFRSVVDAVRCAAEIQRRMALRNADVPPARWIQFRVGINLGDMIVDDDDVFGDGVNVAARLQTLADPGGICVSAAVRDQVAHRLDDVDFDDLGEQSVKNIARPIRAFRVRLDPAAAAAASAEGNGAPAGIAKKPGIAVLPLANMSGDPEQEFFADGLTEDIITEVSRFRDLMVISRNSTFVHKGKAVKVQEVGREFGVDYVLEGSVRKAGDRVRVTVQLIEAESDRHIWAERYDRDLADIFAIQDEITRAIVGTLASRVEAATHERAKRKPTGNMAAYECVLAAKVLHHRSTRDDNAEAQRLLDRAIALDPGYAHAHAWRACALAQSWIYGWTPRDTESVFAEVHGEVETALSLDESDSDVHRVLAALSLARNDHDKAAYHQDRALALNPNYDLVVVQQGELLTWRGRPEEGIDWIRRAMRLNPYHPERFWSHLGRACYCAERYAEAAEAFARITLPDHAVHAFLAATFAQLGVPVAASAHAAEVLKRAPDFSVASHMATQHYEHDADRRRHEAGLLKAGLPP
jgi:adenylate cyclase